jgi:hypothetical protein
MWIGILDPNLQYVMIYGAHCMWRLKSEVNHCKSVSTVVSDGDTQKGRVLGKDVTEYVI